MRKWTWMVTSVLFFTCQCFGVLGATFSSFPGSFTSIPEHLDDPDPDLSDFEHAQAQVNEFLKWFEGKAMTNGAYAKELSFTNEYKGPPVEVSITLRGTASIPTPRNANYINWAQLMFEGVTALMETPLGPGSGDSCDDRGYQKTRIATIQLRRCQKCVLTLSAKHLNDGCSGVVQCFDLNGTVIKRLENEQPGLLAAVNPAGCQSCGDQNDSPAIDLGNINGPTIKVAFGKSDALGEENPGLGTFIVANDIPTTNFFNLERLVYQPRSGVEIIYRTNTFPYIRQVKGVDGLADVQIVSTNGYEIRIYVPSNVLPKDSTGLWCFTNTPTRTVSFLNGIPGATNGHDLFVLLNELGNVRTNHYCYISTNQAWTLTRADGLVQHSSHCHLTNSGNYRIDTHQLCITNTGAVSYKSMLAYTNYSWGMGLVKNAWDTNVSSWALSCDYYSSTNDYGYLKPKLLNTTRGDWIYYTYDSARRQKESFGSFLNQAFTTNTSLCRYTSYDYALLSGAGDAGADTNAVRTQIDYVLGREVARSYWIYLTDGRKEIKCVAAGAAWNDAANLVTTTRNYTNGSFNGWRKSVQAPDGTFTLHEYGTNSTSRTNIVWHGQPDGSYSSVVDGTKSVTILGMAGQVLSSSTYDIATGILLNQETYSNFDGSNRPGRVTHLDGSFEDTVYGCCGPESTTDASGQTTTYTYDNLKRQTARTTANISQLTTYNSSSQIIRSQRQGTNGSTITLGQYAYDTAGRITFSTNAMGAVTSYLYGTNSSGASLAIAIQPDGSTTTNQYYFDGRLDRKTGSAVHPVRYDYGVEQDDGVWRVYAKEIKLDNAGNDTSEWTKSYQDFVGRAYKVVFPDGAFSQSTYNSIGQLTKQSDPDSVATLHAYNARGERVISALDSDRDGIIDTNGTDRVQMTASLIEVWNSQNCRINRSYVWATNNSAVSNLISESISTTDGRTSWSIAGGVTNRIDSAVGTGGNRYTITTTPDGSSTSNHWQNGMLQNVTRKDSAGTQLSRQTYFYDAHGRQYAVTDARNGTSFQSYNDADRVVSTTTPLPGSGGAAQTTTYEHDWAGRITRTVLPDGTSVTNEYHLTGELKKSYGSRTYPVQYAYDPQGRRTNMVTWKSFATDSGKATTSWEYSSDRGLLTRKRYDDTNGPTYTYTPSGRMRTRTWARGVVTTYHTNSLGDLVSTTYSDTTPGVTNYYDRLGRITNILDGSGSRFRIYDANNQLSIETNASGALIGTNLRYTNDIHQRRVGMVLYATNTALVSHSYAFDGASRMTSISDGTYQAEYSYLANSPLISQILYRSNTTTRMTTTKTYDFLDRLTSIASQPSASGATPISYAYTYNDANQRVRVNIDDGSFWLYEYDSLGQLISGKRYWNDWTPVAGQQYEYAFDDIGNRAATKAGGDVSGAGLRSASYTANALNQYTSRDVPAYLNVFGIAHPNSTLTVNSSTPYRKGEFFWKELNVDNSTAAQWQAIENIASLTGTNQTNTGSLFLAKTAEAYTYDLDGNLTSDGRWTNRWDGENRLIDMTSHAGGPSGSRKSLQFGYDSQSRRYSKVVSNWTGSAWARTLHHLFVYEGWNLVGELNGTNAAIIRSYLWGLDLSGSRHGAGGVGGLICIRQHSGSQAGSHFAAFDGNGNVMALTDSGGNISARYEYDPFGQTVRASGYTAAINPMRFSSKYVDDETDLAYYGYRYLNVNSGRWLNRDPITERGSLTLYCMVFNDPITDIDRLGLIPVLRGTPNPVDGGAGNCGQFWWYLTWGLSNPEGGTISKNGGVIVQKINATFDVWSCSGHKFSAEELKRYFNINANAYPFYEAWTVERNRGRTTLFTKDGRSYDDLWQVQSFGACTRGTISIVGLADYYDNQVLPDYFKVDFSHPSSGLPYSDVWNEDWATSGTVVRTLVATWDCCGTSPITEVSAASTFPP